MMPEVHAGSFGTASLEDDVKCYRKRNPVK
jgi:hypothetical protein